MSPTQLSTSNPEVRRTLLERAKALAATFQSLNIRGPFMGLVKDIDPNLLPATAASNLENVRARATKDGEVLMLAPGFAKVAAATLPLDSSSPIQMLEQFQRTSAAGAQAGEQNITLLALTSGDGSTPESAGLYRIKPSTGAWEVIDPTDAGSYDTSDDTMDHLVTNDTTAALPQSFTYPPGIIEPGGSLYGPIQIIMTPSNEVMVYPAGNASPENNEYITLDQMCSDAFGSFSAVSGAYFNGRCYFLNTTEGTTQHRQRVRRSQFGSANIDPANRGAGAFEIRDFKRDGLRLLPLDQVLVAYFEDGTAFISRTNQITNPDTYDVVSRRRGLLSSGSVADTGDNRHFVIASDGWFWLDANGRWAKIGLATINDIPVNKWQQHFYNNLDKAQRHRLVCHYIRDFNQVAIIYPRQGDDVVTNGPQEVWIYDIESDRVFIDRYQCNVFGAYDATIRGPLTYDTAGGSTPVVGYEDFTFPMTYDTVGALSYAGAAGRFGLEQLVHGNNLGLVFVHDSQIFTRDATEVSWLYEFGLRQLNASRFNLTADRAQVEYIHAGAAANTANGEYFCNVSGGSQSRSLDLTRGTADEVHNAKAFYRFTSTSVGYRLTGDGPFMIRALDLDLWADEIEGDRA